MSAKFILKQPMTSAYCLACKGCCRFQEANSPWRPKVYLNEDEIFGTQVLDDEILDEKRCIPTKFADGQNFCKLLDVEINKCTVYLIRPLECRLYPFLFVKKQGTVFLAVHLACPFVQEEKDTEEFEGHCQSLKIFFAQDQIKEFLKKNTEHIFSGHVLKDETEIIFPICSS
ncbi:MAG: YkgJ family cysteine cluster protein [Candidatus Omnitrophica bacterium]|nr:YkgJ family cysteine cluster protein [Candidatus Omnitrophota bacterium]